MPSSRLRSRGSPSRSLTTTGWNVERHDEVAAGDLVDVPRPGRRDSGELRLEVGLVLRRLGEHHHVLDAERLQVRHADRGVVVVVAQLADGVRAAAGSSPRSVMKWYGVVPEASKNRPSMLAMQPSVQCGRSISAIVVPYLPFSRMVPCRLLRSSSSSDIPFSRLTRSRCRCCRCATWSCSRTWSSRCSSAGPNRSRRSKPRWKRAARSCSWHRRPPARTSPRPTTCSRSAASSSILQMLKLPDGTVKVLVEGLQRADTKSPTPASTSSPRCRRSSRRRADARGRGDAPRRDAAVRPVRQAQQEDSARDPHLDRRHRRRRPPGRHHRRAPAAQARGQAVGAGPRLTSPSAWRSCSSCSSTRSTSCRSKSASVAASSGRWRRASASTT